MVDVPYKDPKKANAKRMERYYAQLERERQRSRDYYAANRERVLDRNKGKSTAWMRANPDATWAYSIKKAHGLLPDQWFAMLDEQRGLCYLCEKPLPEDRSKIAIDHDHSHCPKDRSCGLCRRGMAHMNCNSGVGLFGDDPALLRLAAANLEQSQALTQAVLLTAPEQDPLFTEQEAS
jgi:hypothetical protein